MKNHNDPTTFVVVKANGEQVPYDQKKIRQSLKRAGASPDLIDTVVKETEAKIYDGITTKALYNVVFRLLKSLHRSTAGKYHLKRAIVELGPSGFPFERFVAAILHAEGFNVAVDQIVQGQCVEHEVDVVAIRDDGHIMVECKFHSDRGRTSDVKDALYIHARFLDVERAWNDRKGKGRRYHEGWLVTNTRFSSDALKYGGCAGLYLLSWDHPKGGSLRERIDRNGVHPITCMTTLKRDEHRKLVARGLVLCSTLRSRPEVLKEIGLSNARIRRVLDEAEMICRT